MIAPDGRGMKKRISVLVAHQEPAYSHRLRRIFRRQKDLALLDPAETETDLVRMIRKRRPRVLLLDAHFVRGNGYRLLAELRQRSPATKVILLDNRYRTIEEVKAAKVGARGYIGGKVEPATLRKAVRVTEAGEIWMRRKTMSLILDEFLRLAPPP